jgi:p-aminobenzoyl-glutamate transporter AbgT
MYLRFKTLKSPAAIVCCEYIFHSFSSLFFHANWKRTNTRIPISISNNGGIMYRVLLACSKMISISYEVFRGQVAWRVRRADDGDITRRMMVILWLIDPCNLYSESGHLQRSDIGTLISALIPWTLSWESVTACFLAAYYLNELDFVHSAIF